MRGLTADGYPMTTTDPPGHAPRGENVWIRDITSLEPGAMPWQCSPFGDRVLAERLVLLSRDLTFQDFTTLYEPLHQR